MPIVTTIDQAALAKRIGAKPDDPEVQRCPTVALVELERATTDAFRPIPAETMDEMVLSVGQGMWDRRKTSSTGGGQLPRTPRDPLASVRSLLEQYVVAL